MHLAESISAAGALFPWTFSNPSSRKWLTFDLHDLCPLYRSLHCSALCCWVDAVGRSGIVVVSQSTDGITTLDVWKLQKDEKWEFLCDSLVSIWPEYEATSVRVEWYLLMFLISQYPCYVSQYSRRISNTKAIHLRGLHCNPNAIEWIQFSCYSELWSCSFVLTGQYTGLWTNCFGTWKKYILLLAVGIWYRLGTTRYRVSVVLTPVDIICW